jgi:hypothetical protein
MDTDIETYGVQISLGEFLMGGTVCQNNVDNHTGRIDFTADTPIGESVSGSGAIAYINFRIIDKGDTELKFDFDRTHNRSTILLNASGKQIYPVIEIDKDLQVCSGFTPGFCVYPNPCRPGQSEITFAGLPDDRMVNIRIFNIAGELIRQESVHGTSWKWNITNENEEPVAGGIYIYVVTGDGYERVGKVGLIR